jgi:uroporphyrinogen III methyltransferase / synthase
MVYLVGAGPGDPGLLTQRGAELIARAEVLVYDALVNPDLVRLAPKGAEIIYGGKRSKDHAIPQDQLNQLLVDFAKKGKTVVRLKGGDPYVFGRGGEEAEELAAAGVPFEVVPGISSSVAAGNYAGIPITHRDHCSSFHVITGHEDPTKESNNIDWAVLAKATGTKVILMGVERTARITAQLVGAGMDPDTPAAMIRWGTTPRQETVVATLGTLAERAASAGMTAPAITIVGGVVSLRERLDWFGRRALKGRRIVVTRTREQASQLTRKLAELGADVLEIPTIRIAPPTDFQPLVEAIAGLGEYEWLVFTSPNGVVTFFDYFFKTYDDIRTLGGVRIAAVGPSTAAKLKELHLRIDAMPGEFVAEKIADAMAADGSVENLRVLCLRAEVAAPELPKLLEEKGAIVDDVACYRTLPETEDLNGAAARLGDEGADWVAFTSASTVENFHARFDLPALLRKFPQLKTAVIGPETAKAVRRLGLNPTIEAATHTVDGLVDAITAAERSGE